MERCKIDMIHGDCMEFMKDIGDNYYELAIVDPPYGIGFDGENEMVNKKSAKWHTPHGKGYVRKKWDVKPDKKYFDELFRISRNQIIWGGNHFELTQSSGWIFWDKDIPIDWSLASGELAWTSFSKAIKKFFLIWHGFRKGEKTDRFHPTQKPVALYKWLLQNYAKEGDKILDTHGGSASIAIACWDLKFDLTLVELDKDYYDMSVKRLEDHKLQGQLF